jgi:hypothetical protein
VKTLMVQCPDDLAMRLQELQLTGWIGHPDDVVVEALRRYLEGHDTHVREQQVLADVEWGLNGDE